MDKIYSAKELYNQTPDQIVRYLNRLCSLDLPPTIESIDDLKRAGELIGRMGALYSFLTNMRLTANLHKRRLKKIKEAKEEFETALIKEEIFASFCEQIKTLNNALSRQITIKQMINQEMRML